MMKFFKNWLKNHKYCLFHFYCQRKNKERYQEPYFDELAKVFWIINSVILLFHFAIVLRWYTYLNSHNLSDLAGQVMVMFFIALFTVVLLGFVYRYPQYSNIPYSLLIDELPTKRQAEVKYVFKQLAVTSAGYLAVFFLTISLHMIGLIIGLRSGLFISLYWFLLIMLIAKFAFATWFLKATRKHIS